MRRFRWLMFALAPIAAMAMPSTSGALEGASAVVVGRPASLILHNDITSEVSPSLGVGGYRTRAPDPTEAQGSFVIPSFTCTRAHQTFELSVQLVGSPDSATGWVDVWCDATGPPFLYRAFACADPGVCSSYIYPAPGDTITITDTLTTSQASAFVDDVTSGTVASQPGPGETTTTDANFVVQTDNSNSIPTFTKAKFKDCTVNRTPISANDPISFPLTKTKDGKSITQVKFGQLNSAGDGFAATFEHH